MADSLQLPGFERLISIFQSDDEATIPSHMGFETGVELRPPGATAPRAGDLVAGCRVDPMLAALYGRCDGGRVGDLHITPHESLAHRNESMRNAAEPPLAKLFVYASFWGFAYYLATIPSLADATGLQPVVYFDDYDEKLIFPVASNIDRAFALYADYAESLIRANGSFWVDEGPGEDLEFPYSLTAHIARDEKLVDLIERGRFHDVVMPGEKARRMLDQILRAAGRSR